jgi:hypothetical protein
MEARGSAAVGIDVIFDGLCYLGGGTWRHLKELTSSAGDDEFDSHNLIAALVGLGHIDAAYDDRRIKPSYWTVAPPALVFTPGGEAFLAGFRNKELLDIVSERLQEAGGVIRIEPQMSAPSAYLWSGLVPKEAVRHLAGVTDTHGRYVAVSVGFSGLVANAAQPLSRLAGEMPSLRIGGQKDLSKFDPHTVSWRSVSKVSLPGAYSADFFGRRYVYVDDEGSAHEGSAGLVKILAAKREGVMLHGYDPGRSELQFISGCQPPGLLSRALVACSGLLPRREGRRQMYSGVTADLATSIITKLYS